MTDSRLTPFTREKIARLAEDALRRSQTVGIFPTPIVAVQKSLGVSRPHRYARSADGP